MNNLQVIAVIKFKEEFYNDVLKPLENLVEETRKEKGCIQYDLIEDMSQKGTFVMVEIWESHETLEAHHKTEHLMKFGELVREKQGEVIVYKGNKLF